MATELLVCEGSCHGVVTADGDRKLDISFFLPAGRVPTVAVPLATSNKYGQRIKYVVLKILEGLSQRAEFMLRASSTIIHLRRIGITTHCTKA